MTRPQAPASSTDGERAEILDEMARIDQRTAALRADLGIAKAKAARGRYSDPKWYWRKHEELDRLKGRRQELQAELSQLKRRQADRFGALFIDAARELLEPELFATIMKAALARRDVADPTASSAQPQWLD